MWLARLTDRPDMTLAVYSGRKTTTQQQQQKLIFFKWQILDTTNINCLTVLISAVRISDRRFVRQNKMCCRIKHVLHTRQGRELTGLLHNKTMTPNNIGVGRFRILGGPRGGGQIPSRHMTS